jgi:hypothetical protein
MAPRTAEVGRRRLSGVPPCDGGFGAADAILLGIATPRAVTLKAMVETPCRLLLSSAVNPHKRSRGLCSCHRRRVLVGGRPRVGSRVGSLALSPEGPVAAVVCEGRLRVGQWPCTLPIACCRAISTPTDPGVDVHTADVGTSDCVLTVIAGEVLRTSVILAAPDCRVGDRTSPQSRRDRSLWPSCLGWQIVERGAPLW